LRRAFALRTTILFHDLASLSSNSNVVEQRSNRLQVLDQIAPLLIGDIEFEVTIVVPDNVLERREPTVMVEFALMDLSVFQRSRNDAVRWRSIS
jgi:hypothetical protein